MVTLIVRSRSTQERARSLYSDWPTTPYEKLSLVSRMPWSAVSNAALPSRCPSSVSDMSEINDVTDIRERSHQNCLCRNCIPLALGCRIPSTTTIAAQILSRLSYIDRNTRSEICRHSWFCSITHSLVSIWMAVKWLLTLRQESEVHYRGALQSSSINSPKRKSEWGQECMLVKTEESLLTQCLSPFRMHRNGSELWSTIPSRADTRTVELSTLYRDGNLKLSLY